MIEIARADLLIFCFTAFACGVGIGYFVGRKSGIEEGYDKAHLELHNEIEKRLKPKDDGEE